MLHHMLQAAAGTQIETREIAYVTSVSSASNLSSYTFSATSLGDAAVDRYIAITCHSGGAVVSSATVGGVSATVVVTNSTETRQVGIAYALVPTGTTGDVVVTMTGTATEAAVSVYRLTGFGSLAVRTSGSDSDRQIGAGSVSITVTLNGLSAGDVCLVAGSANNVNLGTTDLSWSVEAAVGDVAYRSGFFEANAASESVTAGGSNSLTADASMAVVAFH